MLMWSILRRLPRASLAGVLVLLCPGDAGLSVVLTTRAKTMRSFPGETALPGGRMEDGDVDIARTAIREAEEEIGLAVPVDVITTLPPFLSKNLLFVAPVVAVSQMQDNEILKTFTASEAEVGAIWSWPLADFLGLPNILGLDGPSSERAPVAYAYKDVKWLGGHSFRLREFHNDAMPSPVTGLTADILLETALLAYGVTEPGFQKLADGQMTNAEMVEAVLAGRAGKDGDERSSIRRRVPVAEDKVGAGMTAASQTSV